MTHLPTLGILAITDGRLMGSIGDVYAVVSFFIGRPAFTHELPKYGMKAEPLLLERFPDLAPRPETDWTVVRDEALARHGETIDLPDEWAGSLADGMGPNSNIYALAGEKPVVFISNAVSEGDGLKVGE